MMNSRWGVNPQQSKTTQSLERIAISLEKIVDLIERSDDYHDVDIRFDEAVARFAKSVRGTADDE